MAIQQPAHQTIQCPQCGADITKEPWGITWCERCDWNLEGPEAASGSSPKGGRAERLAQKRGKRLHEEMLAARGDHQPRPSARWFSYVFAALIHLPAGGLLLAAVLLVKANGLTPGSLLLAAIPLGLAVTMRPRLGTLPRGLPVVSRKEAPALFALTDEISKRLGTRPVRWISFDMRYNASTQLIGIRRQRLITIGLPLWLSLSHGERVATLAHEIAHDRNGDIAHSLIVGSALEILEALTRLLTPRQRRLRTHPVGSMFESAERMAEWLVSVVMRGLRGICRFLSMTLLTSSRRASPRAEYLADVESVRVASAPQVSSLLDKFYLDEAASLYVKVLAKQREAGFWPRLVAAIDAIPPKERERLRRVGRRAAHRVDETHPPTALRLDVVGHLSTMSPVVVIGPMGADSIDREIASAQNELSRRFHLEDGGR